MYKLLLFILFMVGWTLMQAVQTDGEMAMQTLFHGKHAVNRAAHAGAQQLDMGALAEGRLWIDERAAAAVAQEYLRYNLKLGDDGEPLPGSYLRESPSIVAFEVINSDREFPYTYRNMQYDYEVTLQRPGVVMIAYVPYTRAFHVIDPIEWHIKGTAELVSG
ncbi:hypothetical protein [Paenibacillus daejeonensis]|uniref:hypothetical protein n=1 Tax=Paenibacillus daejeonensis TaxID=135193 RepID=UPI00035D5EED|nr:hypothetical protein [Paenibacillus daejeonensis]